MADRIGPLVRLNPRIEQELEDAKRGGKRAYVQSMHGETGPVFGDKDTRREMQNARLAILDEYGVRIFCALLTARNTPAVIEDGEKRDVSDVSELADLAQDMALELFDARQRMRKRIKRGARKLWPEGE